MRLLVTVLVLQYLLSSVCAVVLEPADVGLGSNSGFVAGFGDFNGDKFTDFVLVSKDLRSARVFVWDNALLLFSPSPTLLVSTSDDIQQTIASDFDHDGRLDLVVVTSTQVTLHLRGFNNVSFVSEVVLGPSAGKLLACDLDGDFIVDLFGASSQPDQYLWMNHLSTKGNFSLQSFPTPLSPLLVNGSHAFVDMDGDCRADIVAHVCLSADPTDCTQPALSFWRNLGEQFEALSTTVEFPAGSGAPVFADFDGDGLIDIAVSDPAASLVHIYYSVLASRPTALCSAVPSSFQFTQVTVSVHGLAAGPVAAGDVDRDGFPDLLIQVNNAPQLMLSVLCTTALCSPAAVTENRRTFVVDTVATAALAAVGVPELVAFVDVADNGALDIVLSIKSSTGQHRVLLFSALLEDDPFFVKLTGLNGVCPAWCSTGPAFPDPKPFGVNQPGVMFKLVVTDLDGIPHTQAGCQLSQSFPPQAPYFYAGLGRRVGGRLDEVAVGMPVAGSHTMTWLGVLPNAVLVVIPYPREPSEWQLMLFMSPSERVWWVVGALAAALAASGIASLIFRCREQKIDDREKRTVGRVFF